jgi:hypothetical protein
MQDVKIQEVVGEVKTVPVGMTLAVLVDNSARQGNLLLRVITSGSTLQIIGAPFGTTLTAAQLDNYRLAGASAAAFLVDSGVSPLKFDGPVRFYMGTAGAATLTVTLLKGMVSQS